jgi:hypothetical protein
MGVAEPEDFFPFLRTTLSPLVRMMEEGEIRDETR